MQARSHLSAEVRPADEGAAPYALPSAQNGRAGAARGAHFRSPREGEPLCLRPGSMVAAPPRRPVTVAPRRPPGAESARAAAREHERPLPREAPEGPPRPRFHGACPEAGTAGLPPPSASAVARCGGPEAVARACYAHYERRLPKRGKPAVGREWTLLAAVLKAEAGRRGPGMKEIVAMGTGTKCVGQSDMRKTGDILNDSHAEVVAKRSFQRCQPIVSLPEGFQVQELEILPSQLRFIHSCKAVQAGFAPGQGKVVPSGAAISWSAVPEHPLDVTSRGFKQGTTKKRTGSLKSRSRICKVELFHAFLKLVASIPTENLPETLRAKGLQTYWEYKEAAAHYQEAWQELRSQVFGSWVRSSRSYLHFT